MYFLRVIFALFASFAVKVFLFITRLFSNIVFLAWLVMLLYINR